MSISDFAINFENFFAQIRFKIVEQMMRNMPLLHQMRHIISNHFIDKILDALSFRIDGLEVFFENFEKRILFHTLLFGWTFHFQRASLKTWILCRFLSCAATPNGFKLKWKELSFRTSGPMAR